jgi:5-methyltetrahydropteroyltriglutamate--homocysteine methyltransferase
VHKSDNRILTTHAGSLPRSPRLTELLVAVSRHEDVSREELEAEIESSTSNVIAAQRDAGVDIGNDGEQSRESFVTYVQHRLSGFGGSSDMRIFHDIAALPGYIRRAPRFGAQVDLLAPPKAVSEVEHLGGDAIDRECDRFMSLSEGAFTERFVTAASPGIVCSALHNDHYASYDDYVMAVAEAMRVEYAAIAGRGFVLQLDCPDLAMERHVSFGDRPLEQFKAFVQMNISALAHAVQGIPRDRIRMHVCWGNYDGPHHLDVELSEILPLLYEAPVGAVLLPFANPRHAHEWRVLKQMPPPADWVVVAGVIDTTTNYVEHPETVADRIEQVAGALGDPTRVLAGTDCGFDTAAGRGQVASDVVWEKLRSLRAGAELASARLM